MSTDFPFLPFFFFAFFDSVAASPTTSVAGAWIGSSEMIAGKSLACSGSVNASIGLSSATVATSGVGIGCVTPSSGCSGFATSVSTVGSGWTDSMDASSSRCTSAG
ncbi:hypothetical protein HBI49_161010 [Parastagonospora nodorum]|nr:hypothetical protein HBI49_161010 [Parastagonospora nodorum]